MTLADTERPETLPTPPPDAAGASSGASGRVGPAAGWVRICSLDDLEVERGRAALLGDEQVALFLTHAGRVFAVSNLDPYSGAHVISRGIVGTKQDAPTVASPMYKQIFDLRTGLCLDTQGKEPKSLKVWPVAVSDGDIHLKQDLRP